MGNKRHQLSRRPAPLQLTSDVFRRAGHALVDDIAELMDTMRDRRVTTAKSPSQIKTLIGTGPLPGRGTRGEILLRNAADMLIADSLFNGHPKFWGYVTSSPAPIGILGDLLASGINQNVGAFALSPVATEIEAQTIRWIAEIVDYPVDCGGVLVSGGNTANFVGFLAARKHKAAWNIRKQGLSGQGKRLRVYCSEETHTWIQKAADMYGLGTDAIVYIPTDDRQRMDVRQLESRLRRDRNKGLIPFLLVGNAGTVGTGAVDPLRSMSSIARKHDIWFHIDGAYGGFAAMLPDAHPDMKAMGRADSLAVDPHKWLYAPLEAGCALVRDPEALRSAFSYHPVYYRFDDHKGEEPINYHELGPQNSRGFRALKVWLALKQAGRTGYQQMISADIALAQRLYEEVGKHTELEAMTSNLSITTFRYAPRQLRARELDAREYLNRLNAELLERLQQSGNAYPSNAIVRGVFAIRVCIVNFRTTLKDILALPEMVISLGKTIEREWDRAGKRSDSN